MFVIAVVARVELVGRDTDVAVSGDDPRCYAGDRYRGVFVGCLHSDSDWSAAHVAHACGRGARVVDDVFAVVGNDLDGGLVPDETNELSGPVWWRHRTCS